MKVGDYVRTKDGKFFKWNNLCTTDKKDYEEHTRKILFDENKLKSSPNIIDLLQPMDQMYIDISPDNCGGIVVPRIPETYCELNQIINEIKLGNYVLKGIVTKEQLMENMYKVESEVN